MNDGKPDNNTNPNTTVAYGEVIDGATGVVTGKVLELGELWLNIKGGYVKIRTAVQIRSMKDDVVEVNSGGIMCELLEANFGNLVEQHQKNWLDKNVSPEFLRLHKEVLEIPDIITELRAHFSSCNLHIVGVWVALTQSISGPGWAPYVRWFFSSSRNVVQSYTGSEREMPVQFSMVYSNFVRNLEEYNENLSQKPSDPLDRMYVGYKEDDGEWVIGDNYDILGYLVFNERMNAWLSRAGGVDTPIDFKDALRISEIFFTG